MTTEVDKDQDKQPDPLYMTVLSWALVITLTVLMVIGVIAVAKAVL